MTDAMKELYDIFKEESKDKWIKEGKREGNKRRQRRGYKRRCYKYITYACKRRNNFSRRCCKKSKSKRKQVPKNI